MSKTNLFNGGDVITKGLDTSKAFKEIPTEYVEIINGDMRVMVAKNGMTKFDLKNIEVLENNSRMMEMYVNCGGALMVDTNKLFESLYFLSKSGKDIQDITEDMLIEFFKRSPEEVNIKDAIDKVFMLLELEDAVENLVEVDKRLGYVSAEEGEEVRTREINKYNLAIFNRWKDKVSSLNSETIDECLRKRFSY